ncbi:3-hydroxyacyl-CoA dehydrogenase NAD-binding domain-containing protein [Bradyrhizobium sp. USDA 4486]
MSKRSEFLPERRPRAVGLLGGGVIGAGWAARFILNGVDVQLYDPARGAVESVHETLASARRAYRRLTLVPLPAEGALTVANSVADAVRGAELVQESASERLELKQQLLAQASLAAAPETLICSSTSGFQPSLLQAGVDHPERLLIAHPFNPVYLLPLVELCAGRSTAPEMLARAAAIYRMVGMHPLVVRKEVDGFVANRLQEALWREALWLVHDDVATVEEVDDAVRYSFGLRRAVVGPFRVGGGGSAMRNYLEKWKPELTSPWTKLTDAPKYTDAFLDKLAEQSDIRAEKLTATELVEKRDNGLVAVLRGLRSEQYGAGETLARWEQGLRDRIPQLSNAAGPLRIPSVMIPSDWIDNNGRLNESRYLELCSMGTNGLLSRIGIDGAYRSRYGSYYALETHLTHVRELYAGDRVQVLTQVLGADRKRLHIFHMLTNEGDEGPAATCEQMLNHVDTVSGHSGPAPETIYDRVLKLARLHAELPHPQRAGASIGLS